MKKVTIIIGAGASADFRIKSTLTNQEEDKVRMPTGEELSKLIANKDEIINFFYFKHLKEITKGFFHHPAFFFDSTPENIGKTINAVSEYLTSESSLDHEWNWDNASDFSTSLSTSLTEIMLEQNGVDDSLSIDKAHQITNWLLQKVIEQKRGNIHHKKVKTHEIREWLHNEIIKSDEFKIYFELSKLVEYYKPFSIDELLDSIRSGKVDVQPFLKNSDAKKISDPVKLQEYRNALVVAGKELIALFLLREEDIRVFENKDAVCWYRHLRNLIITSGKNSEEIKKSLENLTIISFNYDRSLDYFLCRKIGQEFYNQIEGRIVYPYGKLAQNNFDWELQDYDDIPYGHYKTNVRTTKDKHDFFEKVKILGKNLRVIGELSDYNGKNLLRGNNEKIDSYCKRIKELNKDFTNDHDKKIISDLLLICDVMKGGDINNEFYFLGFGFHEENCRIINLRDIRYNNNLSHITHYTNFANSKKIRDAINNSLYERYEDHTKNCRFNPSSGKGVHDALLYDLHLSF